MIRMSEERIIATRDWVEEQIGGDLVVASSETPTDNSTEIWINTGADEIKIPEINDEIISADDTWSSQKISQAIGAAGGTDGGSGSVEVDATLTQSGLAADAKAVGDKFEALSAVANSGSYNDLSDKPDAYTLPIANETTLGGVKAVAKTDGMTQEIGVDADGKLWGAPGGGNEDSSAWSVEVLAEGTVPAESAQYTFHDTGLSLWDRNILYGYRWYAGSGNYFVRGYSLADGHVNYGGGGHATIQYPTGLLKINSDWSKLLIRNYNKATTAEAQWRVMGVVRKEEA